nr:PREDICTED: NEDD8-conjugating enzyme Ubc12 [Latimeria chalumnae]|eukprot:XP_006010044.1 PREDICTED: NEDD8-conjugating enzyme Ubc12 [Latimeria chalumnae]
MIKLFSLKQQKKEEESAGGAAGKAGGGGGGGGGKKASAAQLRVQKDINELNLPKTCEIVFPDPDDLLNFKLIICPDEGFYKGGKFVFSFKVGQGYPHDPPKVKCETMVYHPNIDLEGNVCLNILREDWKPVLTINSIIYGLQYLFLVSLPQFYLLQTSRKVEPVASCKFCNHAHFFLSRWNRRVDGLIQSTQLFPQIDFSLWLFTSTKFTSKIVTRKK